MSKQDGIIPTRTVLISTADCRKSGNFSILQTGKAKLPRFSRHIPLLPYCNQRLHCPAFKPHVDLQVGCAVCRFNKFILSSCLNSSAWKHSIFQSNSHLVSRANEIYGPLPHIGSEPPLPGNLVPSVSEAVRLSVCSSVRLFV